MRKTDYILILALVLLGAFLITNADGPVPEPSASGQIVPTAGRDGSLHIADLGVIELVAKKPSVINLGSGITCTLIGRQTLSGVEVNVELTSKYTDGKPKSDRAIIAASSGRQAGILVGGVLMKFTPTLKQSGVEVDE